MPGCGSANASDDLYACNSDRLFSKNFCMQKLGYHVPQEPSIPFFSKYPKDAPSYLEDTCSVMFIAG